MTGKTDDHGTENEAQEIHTETDEPARPRTPFPRYERIGEELADESRDPRRDTRDGEIPHTESYGELWARIPRRSRR